ncbi:YidC/Oxa1 family membrane protein insertase [Streptomyces sp. NPDC017941]|uniref:YidC/Oxa1 family membrane protein insertase n=1 Tax=unclassified Streptomyces TaxID=2593676 RepID=UPI00378FBBD4
MYVFASLVADLADLLEPFFATGATAAAIVLVTACVRLLVHPLSRAAARGQKARAMLSPQIAALRAKHARNPEKFQRALLELHRKEQVSPLAGCLPGLVQLPAFFLLYHLFSSSDIGGRANELLDHKLFTAPLGGRWADALGDGGLLGAPGLVYLALFALVTAVATFNYRRTKRQLAANPPAAPGGEQAPGAGAMAAMTAMTAMTKFMPFLSFMTLFTVAVVPLAAALYVVTSTTWSAVERAFLYRDMPTGSGAMGAAAVL